LKRDIIQGDIKKFSAKKSQNEALARLPSRGQENKIEELHTDSQSLAKKKPMCAFYTNPYRLSNS
jgi:hypothetical protein